MSIGLIPFMTARLDEEYAPADMLAVQGGEWHVDSGRYHRDGPGDPGIVRSEFFHVAARCSEDDLAGAEFRAEHVARYDPGRAKRDIAAKRARLAMFSQALSEMDRMLADDDAKKIDQGAAIGRCEAARAAVKLDAAVYRDHPDYDERWKP